MEISGDMRFHCFVHCGLVAGIWAFAYIFANAGWDWDLMSA